jgi:hypothetical protein
MFGRFDSAFCAGATMEALRRARASSLIAAVVLALAPLGDRLTPHPRVLHAQAVQRVILGTVVDVRDRPVPFAAIAMTGARGERAPAAARTTADDSGRFRLVVPHRDRVVFDARRVGYTPSRIALVPGGDTTIIVLLLPAATNLPRVEVRDAAPEPAGLAGFEQRMEDRRRGAGAGWFITAKDIEAAKPLRATQVVDGVPSIYVRRTTGENFAIYGRSGLGAECPATVYLDGIVVGGITDMRLRRDRRGRVIIVKAGEGAPIDILVVPSDIAGVEAYQRGIFAPPKLQPNDPDGMRCAIVAYWTKHGG